MYGVLTDPVERAAEIDGTARKNIGLRAMSADVGLLCAAVTSYAMWASSDCDHGTSSGIPFSLIAGYHSGRGLHAVPGAYWGAVLLMFVAVSAALVYPMAVARQPRPYFVHVAGSYLLINVATLFSIIATTWAGCKRFDSIRHPTAMLALVGHIASFWVLQHCVLVKVEAVEENASENSSLRRCYRMMYNPVTLGFGVLSSVIPMGVFPLGGSIYSFIVQMQMFFMLGFSLLFIGFTAIATRSLTKSLTQLRNAVMDPVMRKTLRKHLAVHALATAVGNGFTVVYLLTIIGVIRGWCGVYVMFTAFGVDNLLHTLLALTLSGIVGSVCKEKDVASTLEEELGPDPYAATEAGVVEKLQMAAHVVQSSSDGVVKSPKSTGICGDEEEHILQNKEKKEQPASESSSMLAEDLEDLTIS